LNRSGESVRHRRATDERARLTTELGAADKITAAMAEWRKSHPVPRASLLQVADHVDHIKQVAGIDHIGLGGDFDGITSTVVGLDNVSTYPLLIAELLRRGYTDEDVKKIAGRNILRVLRQAEETARRMQGQKSSSNPQIPKSPDPQMPVVVALGDSTTAGTPAFQSPVEAPPNGRGDVTSQYAYWLMQRHADWRVLNRGVNGERTDEIAARFDRDVLAAHPQAVVILGGVNDVYRGRTVDEVQAQLATMYARAASARIAVVACSIIPFDTATAEQNAKMHAINAWILSQATPGGNIMFADTRKAAASASDPDRLSASADGLHPDVNGYHRMADAIEPVLRVILAKR